MSLLDKILQLLPTIRVVSGVATLENQPVFKCEQCGRDTRRISYYWTIELYCRPRWRYGLSCGCNRFTDIAYEYEGGTVRVAV